MCTNKGRSPRKKLLLGYLPVNLLQHHQYTISITTTTFTTTSYIAIITLSTSSDPLRLLNNLSVDFLCHLVGHHVGLTADFLVHHHHDHPRPRNTINMPKTMMMIMTDPFTTNLVVKGPVVKGSVVKGATSILTIIIIISIIIIVIKVGCG